MLISSSQALIPEGVVSPYWVRVNDGWIVDAGRGDPPATPDLRLTEGILTPGYIDVHCHGGGGSSFAEGPDAARQVLAAHRRHGTTTMLASLVSAPDHELIEQAEALRPVVEDIQEGLAGIHLEGPWLSAKHKGAHAAECLHGPQAESVGRLLSTGLVRMVTLAPELPGGIDAIGQVVEAGAVAAIGHTDADYAQTAVALEAGATVGTHLFNGMNGMHHRAPGPAGALLERGEPFIEVIADGVHVHPVMLGLVFAQHPERFLLISDAMAAAGASDGDYTLGALDVRVVDGVARLRGADGTLGAIAGSTLTVSAAVRCAVHQAGVPLAHALSAATANPARMLGTEEVGTLAPGARADLLILDAGLAVKRVMQGGVWVPTIPAATAAGQLA